MNLGGKKCFSKRGSQLIDNQDEFFSCQRVESQPTDNQVQFWGFVNVWAKICESVASLFLTFDFYFYLYLCQQNVNKHTLQIPENQPITNTIFLCQENGLQHADNQAQFLGLSTIDNNSAKLCQKPAL
jgi:hypothetical protein